jgi:hypothetical protein
MTFILLLQDGGNLPSSSGQKEKTNKMKYAFILLYFFVSTGV